MFAFTPAVVVSLLALSVAGVAATPAAVQLRPPAGKNASTPNPSTYSVWTADSAIDRRQGSGLGPTGVPKVSYEHGVFWYGLERLYKTTKDQRYFDWIKNGVETILAPNGTIVGNTEVYSLDGVRTGTAMFYLWVTFEEDRYFRGAQQWKNQLATHPRTPEGEFWHKLSYPNQGWLDGIYMAGIFYAEYNKRVQPSNATAWADVVHQFTLIYEKTVEHPDYRPNSTELLYHGYDYSHVAVWATGERGHSPEIWSRAVGWYMMALVDVLDILPAEYQPPIREILQTLLPRLVKAADPATGAWWLVMSQPGREGNYLESSAVAMFVYSMFKALRLNYATDDAEGSIMKAANRAYAYMVSPESHYVVDNNNGTMSWHETVVVGSLKGNGTYEYYIGEKVLMNDQKGVGAFLLASLEYEATFD